MRNSSRTPLVILVLACACGVFGVNVTIQSNPPSNGGLVQTKPDENVSLTCTVDGSDGPEEVQWLRNGQRVSLNDGNRLNISHVCVQPVTRDDNGVTFTCQLASNVSVKASIRLEVQYPPYLGVLEYLWFEEKSEAALSCDVRSSPPVSVAWKKDSNLLDLSSSSYRTTNDGYTATLFISNINRDAHQGVFACEVHSYVHGVRSKHFSISVRDQVMKFPLGPAITGAVVILLTILLAVISRWEKIAKCFQRTDAS